MNAPFALERAKVRPVDLHEPDEVARLEGFVAEQRGSVFHRPAWLLAVEEGTGQRARGLVVERSGRLTGWLPLTEVHSPIFGRALTSSGFAVEGGVLAGDEETARRLCTAAQEYALRLSCPTIELRGPATGEGWQMREDSHCGFAAPLCEDDDEQLNAIPRKQRAEVRKGLRNHLRVTTGSTRLDRASHYAVYAESVRNLGTPVFPRSLFEAVLDRLDADILTISGSRHPCRQCAVVIPRRRSHAVLGWRHMGCARASGKRSHVLRADAARPQARMRPLRFRTQQDRQWGVELQEELGFRTAAPVLCQLDGSGFRSARCRPHQRPAPVAHRALEEACRFRSPTRLARSSQGGWGER